MAGMEVQACSMSMSAVACVDRLLLVFGVAAAALVGLS